ncbi:lymphocyte function-associated antigen 3-like [Cheilinus undulatus]|uniref:lymphocyte function-associated antigen 3-like n=1 Tax=Cheilinus undulatus TaxID=241271 RepID=UPI001BD2D782|nr:lymphocyte function-associated antigen 3-like [Cheilinus undulatus]
MPHALQKLGLFFLVLSFSPSLADPVYMAIGGDAVLRPPPMDLPIKNIEWKHNEDIAADWHGNEFECFGQFKGRCEVNSDTGALTIKGLNLNDSGIYTPEINGRVPYKIELSVITRIAKPSVKSSCNNEKTYCLLICEGNDANAKPVVYRWFVDGKHGSSYKERNITKDTKGDSFRCLMMNPVSNETSESVTNPLTEQELSWPDTILVPVVIVLVVILFAAFIYKVIRGRRRKALLGRMQRVLHKMGFGLKGTKHEMGPLNQPPDGGGQSDTTQRLSNGAGEKAEKSV